jgi:hypothetical protein
VDAVKKEAEKAKKEMEVKNPKLKLKHDPTRILPEGKLSNHDRYHQQQHHQQQQQQQQQHQHQQVIPNPFMFMQHVPCIPYL